jgi:hypothetical protein
MKLELGERASVFDNLWSELIKLVTTGDTFGLDLFSESSPYQRISASIYQSLCFLLEMQLAALAEEEVKNEA